MEMLDELIEQVQANTGRTDKDDIAEDRLRKALVNLSQLYPFEQLKSQSDTALAIGEYKITMPAIDQIIELRLIVPSSPTMSYSMMLKRKTWFTQRFPNIPNTVITGRPLWCMVDNGELWLDRISNGAYTIRITGLTIGTYADGSDSSPITNSAECMVAYATAGVYASVQQYTDAKFWMGEYGRLYQALRDFKAGDPGERIVADEWRWRRRVTPNQPWLDPFEGIDQHGGTY
jgi:hypothetical protein